MDREKLRILIFSLLMVLFIGVPVYMIHTYTTVLNKGKLYRFKCERVDPSDAFRGKYVQLNFNQGNIDNAYADSNLKSGQNVYAYLKVDSAGFAYVSKVSVNKGELNDNFATTLDYVSSYSGARINFPFERYYMNENLAPLASDMYRVEAKVDSVYLDVRVYNGKVVPEELYLGGMPVREFLKKYAHNK